MPTSAQVFHRVVARSHQVRLLACLLTLPLVACRGAYDGEEDADETMESAAPLVAKTGPTFPVTLPAPSLAVTPVRTVSGRPARLRAMVTRNGVGLSGRTVKFALNGVLFGTTTTNVAGIARLPWTPTGDTAHTVTISATLAPLSNEASAPSAITTASVAAPSSMDTGDLGGPNSFVDIEPASASEGWVEPGIVAGLMTVRRSAFGSATTERDGQFEITFTNEGPGAPPRHPQCYPLGYFSCETTPVKSEAATSDLVSGYAIWSFYDQRPPPFMGGRTTVRTTTWDREKEDAWDACATRAAALSTPTKWNHIATITMPIRAGRLYLYDYPLVTPISGGFRMINEAAFRYRYLDVDVPMRVTCTE